MAGDSGDKRYFTRRLMDWHRTENDRSLPWKLEKDPYRIWLSEIILQQTRAEQGLPYYLRFVAAYPSVEDLAAAAEEDVFRLWQGLGYYNRCRNLLDTARHIASERSGRFPDSFEALLALKGVGPYTAAAIASFAFGLAHAVVDGNVYRVLARYFGIEEAIDSTVGKRLFQSLAGELLDKTDPGGYNQAIMDLGATICTPASPQCVECPLSLRCLARKQVLIAELPVKSKKVLVRRRYFHYVLLVNKGKEVWIRQRGEKDIWRSLHEPLLVEHTSSLNLKKMSRRRELAPLFAAGKGIHEATIQQRLTHQLIEISFFSIALRERIDVPELSGEWVNVKQLKKLAFPRSVVSFLEKKFYF